MLPVRSRGPSPKRPALFGSASFDPSDATHPEENHPVLCQGRVAVVTGAASGIGAAAARAFAALGMKVAIADLPSSSDKLQSLGKELVNVVGEANVLVVPTDVSVYEEVCKFRETVFEAWSEVGILLNNAGVDGGPDGKRGTSWEGLDAWHHVFNVNVFGIVNVQQAFIPAMLYQENPAMVINTGSKQGITNPPGNTAYNATKAAIKSLTEGLAHELRTKADAHGTARITAHLFVPGWTFTGLTGASAGGEKPAGAWSADETVKYMLSRVAAGDFYVVCPDNETTPEADQLRIMWAAADVAQGRPALSRWHRDYKALFEEYMREGHALQVKVAAENKNK
ncbi:hypothetical protein MIND_01181000 [Mycena indigotica]|uniref:NAD(P)-binding protein n=1 Tax=Mycena indigotica TaxID=2126181 RepID=A0A8H6S4T2_9AGAR|nr:uncharacterized protein MIND_01181000 [Mycena indigotica]KAF7292821.1 hypothetical protein MIND_01181000 [Mycena indigotica]